MPFEGFDPEFRDLPDYIVKITERIWEGRGVGLIRRWYAEDCVVHTTLGPIRGAEAVVAGTLDTLNAFPDRRLLAEDVIWSEDAPGEFLSSHRVSAPARHTGESVFGPPTGREVHFRAMADCQCRANQVVEEWLTRDQAAIAATLGLDPDALARRLAERAMAGGEPWHLGPRETLRAGGHLRPPLIHDHPAVRLVLDAMAQVWRAELQAIRERYHHAVNAHVPGGRTLHGHDRLERFLFAYLSAVPDTQLHIEHAIAREGEGLPTRVAVRWWLSGTHAGWGAFGPPSGALLLALGITHCHVVGDLIREEWLVTDEIAIRAQIAMRRG